jgi:AraC-like DNA-binding protein
MCAAKTEGFHAIPSATGGIARLACTRLREVGKDIKRILSRVGLTEQEIDDPAVRLSVSVQIRLLELAATELEDELLGFRLAKSFDLREIGLVYYILASSKALSEALQNAARYSKIANEGIRLNINLNRTLIVSVEYVNVDRVSDRHQIEFLLVALMRIFRQLTDTRLAPLRLKIKHSRVDHISDFIKFFGRDAEFGADADELHFPAKTASLPITGGDIFLNELLRRYADEVVASRPTKRSSFRGDVEHAISQLLPHGRAALSGVAGELGMSSRTLSRKLQAESITFAAILDALRSDLARRYLKERELPISEIAWLLGYSEISSFTHAFKRWTGTTPRAYRLSN